jgi:penicillin-binding protein 1B
VRFERVLDAGTAFLVTSLLEGVVERGTGQGVRAAGIRGPVAAKTGTSNDERDAWFVGFTPELVVVVWIGFDDSRSTGLPASQLALPVWVRFVREATGGQVRGAFLPPPEVVSVAVDPVSGARALAGCPARQAEWFLAGTEPLRVCPPGALFPEDGVEAPRRLLERLFDTWFGDDGGEL